MRFSPPVVAASLALTATLIASPVDAAPILGTAGSGLQNAGIPMENSGRYWDGNSWDSHHTLNTSARWSTKIGFAFLTDGH